MRMRQKKTSSGKVYFYYDTCAKPRKWLPLGSDFFEALRKYADYEQEYSQELTARIERELCAHCAANVVTQDAVGLPVSAQIFVRVF